MQEAKREDEMRKQIEKKVNNIAAIKTNIFAKSKRQNSLNRKNDEDEAQIMKDRQMYGNSTVKKIMALNSNGGPPIEDSNNFYQKNSSKQAEIIRDLAQVNLSSVHSREPSDVTNKGYKSDEGRESVKIVFNDNINDSKKIKPTQQIDDDGDSSFEEMSRKMQKKNQELKTV